MSSIWKFIFEIEKETRIEIRFGYERVKYFVRTCYVQQRSEIGKKANLRINGRNWIQTIGLSWIELKTGEHVLDRYMIKYMKILICVPNKKVHV